MRMTAFELGTYMPYIERLRELGASVIRLSKDGALTLAFEGQYAGAEAQMVAAQAAEPEDEEKLLFASADDE